MPLGEYLRLLRDQWKAIVATTLAVLAIAAGVIMLQTPKYAASAQLFFSVQAGESVSELAQGSSYTEKQMSSFSEVAKSPLVLQPVVDRVGPNYSVQSLQANLSVSVPADTVIMKITVVDTNPARAAQLANGVADELSQATGQLAPQRQGQEVVKATVTSAAIPPARPSEPAVAKTLLAALLLGLAIGVGLALVRRLLDTKVRNHHDAEAASASPVVGTIPAQKGGLPPLSDQGPTVGAEAFRRLRTNLQFAQMAGPEQRSILVTSSLPGEGKTTTSANLALAFAEAGDRVLLVDADLRRPRVASYLGIEGTVGLTTVLIGRAELDDVVQSVGSRGLHVLPAGQIPPNPSELLGSEQMRRLQDEMTTKYDIVILDTAPVLPVTDAVVMSSSGGTTVVVARAGTVQKVQLADAVESLNQVGTKIFGVVLNDVHIPRSDAYAYEYVSEPNRAHAEGVK